MSTVCKPPEERGIGDYLDGGVGIIIGLGALYDSGKPLWCIRGFVKQMEQVACCSMVGSLVGVSPALSQPTCWGYIC